MQPRSERVRQSGMRIPLVVTAATCAALLGGCADTSASDQPGSASPKKRLEHGVRESSSPPPLRLRSGTTTVVATQGSFCWANMCADTVVPQASALPTIGPAATLDALFPMPADWTAWIARGTSPRGCGNYPVHVQADGAGHLELTPSGPPGDRVGGFFVYAGSGDTSGWWRWTTPPRDGVPFAWVHVHQNSPLSGGMTALELIVDDAAVDGEVGAEITVEAADGDVATFAMPEVDQHCRGDGFVELAIPADTPEPKIDGLGPLPYEYDVRLDVDGRTYTGTGTWSGEGTEYGGDALLAFDPPLPVRH